jgi:hypothetical protein
MPANAFLTTAAIGNREDLIDMIYNVSPTDTPLISAIDKVGASAVTHEWQTDVLAAPANNAVPEGADASYNAVPPTVRRSNQTQISRKTFSISHTQEAVSKAGRKSEIRYQTVKQGKELRKDMEIALIENGTLTTGATRQTRGLRGWIATNNSLGATGAAPNPNTNTAPTDGTLRNFTENLLRTVIRLAYTSGGNPEMVMVAPVMKEAISANFTGSNVSGASVRDISGERRQLEAAWDVYRSDFGTLKIVPNRVMSRTREAYVLDPSMAALAVLRDMETEELAKIGAARNFMIETEYALEMRNESAHGCIRDIQAP